LAARLPFALATNDQKEIAKIISDFSSKDAKGGSVVVLNKKLLEVLSVGPDAKAWMELRGEIQSLQGVASWTRDRLVISASPCKSEEDTTGYVVTLTSLDDFLALRSRLRNYAIFVFLVGITVIGVIASILVSRMIVRPILQTGAVMRDIAEGDGDLTRRLQAYTNDEIGELATQFNGFAGKMQEVVRDIANRSQPLAAEAEAVTSASRSLQSSVEQTVNRATSVEKAASTMSASTASVEKAVDTATQGLNSIASAIEEMTSSIGEIAGNSEKASSVTQEVVLQAKEIDRCMADLNRSAQEIDKVTETITSISAQTNLLALNATIEAARAGTAGKGFAVVANEIKELAHQTAAATDDVKSRIHGIQESTRTALSGNERIAVVIGNINELVASIATAINEQATVAREIAANIAQATLGVTQANQIVVGNTGVAQSIARDIGDVSHAANQVRQVSEGLSQNSGRLSTLSQELRALVTKFKY
jgi:methyl-accepting chemotaxis protein